MRHLFCFVLLVALLPVSAAVATDHIEVSVQFQPIEVDEKYLPDAGLSFREQNGLMYGWSTDNTEWTRYRDMERFRGGRHEDERFNTLIHFNENHWQMEVPNGTYNVTVGMGDPVYGVPDDGGIIRINHQTVIQERGGFDQNTFIEESAEVTVTNEKIRIDAGNTPPERGRINFVDIVSTTDDFEAYINFQPLDKFADWSLALENGRYLVTLGLGETKIKADGDSAIMVNDVDAFAELQENGQSDTVSVEVVTTESDHARIKIDEIKNPTRRTINEVKIVALDLTGSADPITTADAITPVAEPEISDNSAELKQEQDDSSNLLMIVWAIVLLFTVIGATWVGRLIYKKKE